MKNSLFVFDTNLLISASLLEFSESRRALNKVIKEGHFVFSEETIIELNSVLIRKKFGKYLPYADRLEAIQRVENKSLIITVKVSLTSVVTQKIIFFSIWLLTLK